LDDQEDYAMSNNPKSTAKIAGHPIHPMLVVFPIAFWIGAFVCDGAYWLTLDAGWTVVAMWLIAAGLIGAAAAAVAGFTDFLGDSRIRALRDSWRHMIGNVMAVLLAAISLWIRYSMGAEPAVLPWGFILSFLIVLILVYTGWKGGEMVYRYEVGVEAQSDTPAVERGGPRTTSSGTGRPIQT
jgi:uncharacterized membrane protein